MKQNKGISLITLVVTIIVMLIILMITYRAGIKYISESKDSEKTTLVSIISDAVERRQNDNYIGVEGTENYYSGYHIEETEFNKISTLFGSTDFEYGPGLWYMVDSISAEQLGVKASENYLVKNILNDDNDESKYLAIADYYTGKVFLIKYSDMEIALNVEDVTHGSDGHVHTNATVATCTEPSICSECGKVITPALGHTYNMEYATCTIDKKCNRCGYIAEHATGHTYGTTWDFDAEGHFHRCINVNQNTGEICNTPGDYSEHDVSVSQIVGNQWIHSITCTTCGYSGSQECSKAVKQKDLIVHTIYCTLCGREEDVEHDVIKYRYVDKYKHIVYCDTCKTDLREANHVDEISPYGICDLCEGVIDISQPPRVVSAVMINTTPTGENEYYAKRGDIIKVTLTTDMMLGGAPKFSLQGIDIVASDVTNPEAKKWVATINVLDYGFTDGELNLTISNIRNMWGIHGDPISGTTDGRVVTYDSELPDYVVTE